VEMLRDSFGFMALEASMMAVLEFDDLGIMIYDIDLDVYTAGSSINEEDTVGVYRTIVM